MTRTIACLALAAALAACGGDSGSAEDTRAYDAPAAAATDSATAAPRVDEMAADTGVAAFPAESVLSIHFERREDRRYMVTGRTSASTLEVTVEDGHNVLYGPERVTVNGGAFRADVEISVTTRPTVYAYITEPGGSRQWVVPIPLSQPRVTWSGGPDPAAPAAGN